MGRRQNLGGGDFDIATSADTKGLKAAGDAVEELDEKVTQAADSAEDASDSAETAESSFSKMAKAALGIFGAVAGIGLASGFIGFAKGAADEVFAWDSAMQEFSAQTGITGDKLEEFEDIAQGIFKSGLGESADAVTQAMAQVENVTGAAGDDLEGLTSSALVLQQAFDKDINESIRAVDNAMTAFGADGQDVFDLIAYTIQKTGDPADDLLDTIMEYSGVMAENGFNANSFFGLLNNGAELGIYNFDRIADAAKEFGIRVREGGEEVQDAFKTVSESADIVTLPLEDGTRKVLDSWDDVQTAFADGSIDMESFMSQVADALLQIEDPIERDKAAVALLGTAYEDLGPKILEAMAAESSIEDADGAINRMKDSLTNGLGPSVNRLKRTFTVFLAEAIEPFVVAFVDAAVPALESLANFLENDAAGALADFRKNAEPVIQTVQKIASAIVEGLGGQEAIFSAVADAFGFIADAGATLFDFISNLSPESMVAIAGALGVMAAPAILGGIAALVVSVGGLAVSAVATATAFAPLLIVMGLVAAYETNFGGLKDSVNDFQDALKDKDGARAAKELGNILLAIPMGLAREISNLLGLDFDGGLASWGDNAKMFGIIITGLRERIAFEFNRIWETITDTFEDVKTTLSDFISGIGEGIGDIGNIFDGPLNTITQTFNGFKDTVGGLLSSLDIKGMISGAILGIPDVISMGLAGLDGILGTNLSGAFDSAVATITGLIGSGGTLLQGVTALPGLVTSTLTGFASTVSTAVYTPFLTVVNSITGILATGGTLLQSISGLGARVTQNTLTLAGDVLAAIETPFLNVATFVQNLWTTGSGLINALLGFPALVISNLSTLPASLVSALETPFTTAKDNVKLLIDAIDDPFLNLGANIVASVGDLLGKLDGAIVQPFRDIISRITSLDWSIEFPSWLPIDSVTSWISGQFAQGGPVMESGFYKVGEGGPEIVWLNEGSHVFTNSEAFAMSHPTIENNIPSRGNEGGGLSGYYIENVNVRDPRKPEDLLRLTAIEAAKKPPSREFWDA